MNLFGQTGSSQPYSMQFFRCVSFFIIFFATVVAASEPTKTRFEKWSSAISNDSTDVLAQLLDNQIADGLSPVELLRHDAPNGKSALMVAAKQGDLALVRQMVAVGADIKELTQTGGTPFMFAVLGNHLGVAQWLHEHGANINAKGSNGWSAATIAGAKGQTELLRWLINAGADINSVDVYRFTPLMRAVDNQHESAVNVLLSLGKAKVNVKDESDNTALHFAVANQQSSVIALLLAYGANPVQQNRNGITPIDLAKQHPTVANLFK